jgi:riboflavin transporter
LIFGPAAGVLVELFKNVLNYLTISSATGVPVGQVANFIAGILFIFPTYYLYKKLETNKGMTFPLLVGSLAMEIVMSILSKSGLKNNLQ